MPANSEGNSIDPELLRKMQEKLVKDLAAEIDRMSVAGMATSTASSTPPPALTRESFEEMVRALEQPKLTKREQLMRAAGFGSPFGVKIIVDMNCYKKKTEVRGLADVRKPNQKKMLYRRVVTMIPLAYLTPMGIICHPSIEAKIRRQLEQAGQGYSTVLFHNPNNYD